MCTKKSVLSNSVPFMLGISFNLKKYGETKVSLPVNSASKECTFLQILHKEKVVSVALLIDKHLILNIPLLLECRLQSIFPLSILLGNTFISQILKHYLDELLLQRVNLQPDIKPLKRKGGHSVWMVLYSLHISVISEKKRYKYSSCDNSCCIFLIFILQGMLVCMCLLPVHPVELSILHYFTLYYCNEPKYCRKIRV
jgi:hypothetical protein